MVTGISVRAFLVTYHSRMAVSIDWKFNVPSAGGNARAPHGSWTKD